MSKYSQTFYQVIMTSNEENPIHVGFCRLGRRGLLPCIQAANSKNLKVKKALDSLSDDEPLAISGGGKNCKFKIANLTFKFSGKTEREIDMADL
jgi:hypothetical protein